MKKFILLTLILGTSLAMNAQKDTKPQLSAVKAQGKMQSQMTLCQLQAYFSEDGKTKIVIDFGDKTTLTERQMEEIKKEGYNQRFSNVIDALRFMGEKGWQLVEDYETESADGKVNNFILKRR